MSKVVKTALVVVAAVAIIVFAPQIAAVLASAAGAIGVTVTAAAITTALVTMGLSMAMTATLSLFRKTPSMTQSMVDRLNTSVVPTAPRKIIFGTTAGGQDVRFFEGEIDLPSTKKDGYTQVIALASHRINALKSWYVENELVWSNGAVVAKRNGFAPANPFRVVLEGKAGNGLSVGSGRYWNSTATFTGCAYYVPFFKLDDEVWESGIPQRLTAVVEGCPLYDPRRDSSRGGSGTHRIDSQDTWAFRDGTVEIGRNPALALLAYLTGWRINGKLAWGMGVPAHRIDFDNFRTYANLCEEQVATQGGGTVQRYTADGIYSTADSHETVIGSLTAAMGSCKLTDPGGMYRLIGGYDDTAGPKVDFTADDLIAPAGSASPYIWNPAPSSRERFNIVRGRFSNPAELYQLTDWGEPIEQPPLADGVPRTMTLDLGAVSRPETCQRIAKQFLLREYLCPGMFVATFGPKAFAAEIGSVVTLSLPAEGWNNKLFRVIEQAETHDLFFQMTLREEDPAIYAWDREEKPLPASIRPQGYDASATIAPQNLALTSASYAGANNVHVSEVHVTWTPELSGRVSTMQVESRPQGATAWTEQAGAFDPKLGSFTFTSNAPGITVEVRARYRMTSAVYSAWVQASIATAPITVVGEKGDPGADGLGIFKLVPLVSVDATTGQPLAVMTVTGNTIQKTSGALGYNASAHSDQAYIGGARVSFTAGNTGYSITAGLHADPTSSAGEGGFAYAFRMIGTTNGTGTLNYQENGTNRLFSPAQTFVEGDELVIDYDNEKVRFYKNGALLGERIATPDLRLYFDASIRHRPGYLKDIYFVPRGAAGRDGAQGATGQDGAAGAQGPSGPAGATLYTWIAYANSADGTLGFTNGASSGHSYVGIANNRTTAAESANPADYSWSLIKGTDGVPGTPGANGQPTYTWFAYADSADGTVNFTTGTPGTRTYLGLAANKLTATESTNPADYSWSKVQGPQGPQGLQGIQGSTGTPGAPGSNGQTSYVHFAYADSVDGTANFTTGDAGGRFYVGTYTDFTAADSANPASYAWSRFRGADGANGTPGQPGANGQATYVHIAYADSADGVANFHLSDGTNRRYIGTYTDGTLADSASSASYTWSLIKGADGQNGTSPATVDLSTNAITLSAASDGAIKTGQFPKAATVSVKTGATDVTTAAGTSITVSASAALTVARSGGTVSLTNATGPGTIDVSATVNGVSTGTKRITVSVVADAPPPSTPTSIGADFGGPYSATAYGTTFSSSVTLKAGASGTLGATGWASYDAARAGTGTTAVSVMLYCKLAYRAAGGSTWNYSAGENAGSTAFRSAGEESLDNEPGYLSISQSVGGLTPGAFYEVAVAFRKTGNANAAASGTFTGSTS